jgi:hypothetical protein
MLTIRHTCLTTLKVDFNSVWAYNLYIDLNKGIGMTAITNLIIVLMPVIIMGLAIIVKDGF